MDREKLLELERTWWDAPLRMATGSDAWDLDIQNLNGCLRQLRNVPRWAYDVRSAMPRWGFEMCSHRWLDGLDDVLRMLVAGEDWVPSSAGHCGDVPTWVVAEIELRACALSRWLEDPDAPAEDLPEIYEQVRTWLGAPEADKRQAVAGMLALLRQWLDAPTNHDALPALASEWQERGAANPLIAALFEGEGLHSLLSNGCGFKTVDRLDLTIRLLGGDDASAEERHGHCLAQLRHLWRDDPQRYESTRGILWGLYAGLANKDVAWLREQVPECSGAALRGLAAYRQCPATPAVRRWLIGSFAKLLEIECQVALVRSPAGLVPAYARHLPELSPVF